MRKTQQWRRLLVVSKTYTKHAKTLNEINLKKIKQRDNKLSIKYKKTLKTNWSNPFNLSGMIFSFC